MKNSRISVCLVVLILVCANPVIGDEYVTVYGPSPAATLVHGTFDLTLGLLEAPYWFVRSAFTPTTTTYVVRDNQPPVVDAQPDYDQPAAYIEPACAVPACVAPPVPGTYVPDLNWEPADYWFWNGFEVGYDYDGFAIYLCGGQWMYPPTQFVFGFESYHREHRGDWDHLCRHNERHEWAGRHGGGERHFDGGRQRQFDRLHHAGNPRFGGQGSDNRNKGYQQASGQNQPRQYLRAPGSRIQNPAGGGSRQIGNVRPNNSSARRQPNVDADHMRMRPLPSSPRNIQPNGVGLTSSHPMVSRQVGSPQAGSNRGNGNRSGGGPRR